MTQRMSHRSSYKHRKEAKVLPTPLLRQLPSLLLPSTQTAGGGSGHRNSTWKQVVNQLKHRRQHTLICDWVSSKY